MKLKNAFYTLLILTGLALALSCEKTIDAVCTEKYYTPEALLSWFPYHTDVGETTTFWKFHLENKTYLMAPQTLTFCNASLDTQAWSLVTLVDKFNRATYKGCPIYQQIDYTIYNSKISQHIDFGFVYRDTNYQPSLDKENMYIPMLNVGSCVTAFEYGEGLLGGTCYLTAFDVENYPKYDKVEYLNEFTTQFSTYQDVFLVKLHNPDEDLKYNIYIAKNYGIVAYENQGVQWALH